MNSMSQCEHRVRKLREYIPFLQRRHDQLNACGDVNESKKLKDLIAVISSSKAGELSPAVLERCEGVCKELYIKFGQKEDDIKPEIKNLTFLQPRLRLDPPLIPHERISGNESLPFSGIAIDQTPRSPSPEGSCRPSSVFVPKSIPETRSDTDMRLPIAHLSQLKQETSRFLRSEPVEIPTTAVHSLSSDNLFAKEDKDYRHSWAGPVPPSSSSPSTNFKKRESRFNRYVPDSLTVDASSRWPQSDLSQSTPTQWADPRLPRDRGFASERAPFHPSSFYRGHGSRWQNETLPRPPPPHNFGRDRWSRLDPSPSQRAHEDRGFMHQEDHYSRQNRTLGAGPSRREDPRLVNRPKPPPLLPKPCIPDKSKPHQPSLGFQTTNLSNTKIAPPPLRPSLVPSSSSSRAPHPDARVVREPPASSDQDISHNKADNPPAETEPSVISVLDCPPETARDLLQSKSQPKEKDCDEQSNRHDDSIKTKDFVSPLGGLYDSTKPNQTGRGYGIQKYKIPKKSSSHPKKTFEKSKEIVKASCSLIEVQSVHPTESIQKDSDEKSKQIIQMNEISPDPLLPCGDTKEEPIIPLELVETFLKKNLPSSDAQKVLECLKTRTKQSSESQAEDSDSSLVIDTTVTSTSESSEQKQQFANEIQSEDTDKADSSSQDLDRQEPNKKKNIVGRKKGSHELARLHEDLTDFMKGPVDFNGRRTRTRLQQSSADLDQIKGKETEKPLGKKVETRGRKRKINDKELTIETSEQNLEPELQVNERMILAKPDISCNESSPDGPGKSKKRKKIFTPTRLSLRGRRSMYENSEPNEQESVGSSSEDYFQCRECGYLGQKIVHHYVNEHVNSEIPYVAVPESAWDILTSVPASIPAEHQVDKNLLSDLSWLPSRANYTTPVTCKHCVYSSSKRTEMLEHVAMHAMSSRCEYRCTLCGLSDANFFDLLDHLSAHTGEYRYRCNYCDFRVASRQGIKHHMASLHESQDALFYSTEVPDLNILWVFGYACKNCKYVQMDEKRLERHLSIHADCIEYLKLNLVSIISVENKIPSTDNNQESNVFVCSALESMSNQNVKETELTETLRVPSADWIKSLAEKLASTRQTEKGEVSTNLEAHTIYEKKTPERLTDQTGWLVDKKGQKAKKLDEVQTPVTSGHLSQKTVCSTAETEEKEEKADPTHPAEHITPVKGIVEIETSNISLRNSSIVDNDQDDSNRTIVETDVIAVDQSVIETPKKTITCTWKPNSLLEITISKLADKLGGVETDPLALNLDQSIEPLESVDDDNTAIVDQEDASDQDEDFDQDEDECSNDDSDDSCDEEKQSDHDLREGTTEEYASRLLQAKEQGNPKAASEPVETTLAGFLKIENVVSLTENKEDVECLDPLDDVIIYSNVVLLKNAVCFPYTVEHNRYDLVMRLKHPETYRKMTDRNRLKQFFKCLAFKCFFSSDSCEDFLIHLRWHSRMFLIPKTSDKLIPVHRFVPVETDSSYTLTFPDFLLCSYCPFGAASAEVLVDHLKSLHRDCVYQCSVCTFRAWKPKAVSLHILLAHPRMSAPVLPCSKIKTEPINDIEINHLSLEESPRYRCLSYNCGFTCIHSQSLVAHFSKDHPSLNQLQCPDCTEQFFTGEDHKETLLHYNKHATGFFQCSFCKYGTDLAGDAVVHHCLSHPSYDGKIMLRSTDKLEGVLKTMALFSKAKLEHSRSIPIDFEHNFKELLYSVKVVESNLSPDQDIQVLEIDEKTNEKIPEEEKSCISEPLFSKKETVERGKGEGEFHGFAEEERDQAKQQAVCIVLDSEGDDEGPNEATQLPQDLTETEPEDIQDGLYGRQLFMCGNIGCDETAETAAAFKDHLLICDLARDSRLLTCRHCGKNVKQVANLMDHLRVHGIKRYSCSLCNYRAHSAVQVRKHMKSAHKVTLVDEVSIGFSPGAASLENTLYAIYPKEMMTKLRLRTRLSKSAKARTFSCREVANIPKKSIFSSSIRCAHCGYGSKIRSNIIRHLALHECTESSAQSSENEEIVPKVIIPDQDPVNPVPLIENPSKGRMFDKMANLAGSSHDLAIEREKALADQPVFVPDHQRYVCGIETCSHLTINEAMLKHHLTALHKNGLFTCPHCVQSKEDEPFNIDSYRIHLKMHGPRLYKCGHCLFYHWQLLEIDNHLLEKHPNRPPWRVIIREPDDKEIQKLQGRKLDPKHLSASWTCSLCKFLGKSMFEMQNHAEMFHGIKSQYKCAICPVRCNVRSEFDRHFANKHPDLEVQVLTLFYKKEGEERVEEVVQDDSTETHVHEPLWKKNEYRLRHIRGILLEENELVNPDESSLELPDSTSTPLPPPPEDPQFGTYGNPNNGQLVCPKCNSYRVAYGRDMKVHLYRELDYKKFLCSICNEGSTSRSLCLKHIEKIHPTSGAFIREISYNTALENWVDQVIKYQTEILKTAKTPAKSNHKGKKLSIISPSASTPSSPTKSPLKAQKKSFQASPKFEWLCLACKFAADSQAGLEEHVASSHSTDGGIICLECGFKALTKLAITNHQNRTKHTKTIEATPALQEIKKEPIDPLEAPNPQPTERKSPTKGDSTKKKIKSESPYQCKHCKFSSSTEHNMNVHWQARHAPSKLPLDFECSLATVVAGRTLVYRCQYCNIQPGLYDDMHEHSRTLHPDLPLKLFRVASKGRATIHSSCGVDGQNPPKKQREEIERPEEANDEDIELDYLTKPVALTSAVTISLSHSSKSKSDAPKSNLPALTITPRNPPEVVPIPAAVPSPAPSPAPSPNQQTVFVVAPSQTNQPAYACVWCNSKFNLEAQVIRHHSSHSDRVPLRYTCLDNSKSNSNSTSGKPELAVMEIRFGCPVCSKYFVSLALATQHVHEHKQAWKCGHCIRLFLTPVDALQHMKDAHPGVQGRLESIDSPKEVFDRLSKGITLIRVQLNMKALTKCSNVSAETKEIQVNDAKDGMATSTPHSQPPRLIQTVARKSTSTNMFLKQDLGSLQK